MSARNERMDAIAKAVHGSPAFSFEGACKAVDEAMGRDQRALEVAASFVQLHAPDSTLYDDLRGIAARMDEAFAYMKAADLKIDVWHRPGHVGAGWPHLGIIQSHEAEHTDRATATRRAILKAVAEIQRRKSKDDQTHE